LHQHVGSSIQAIFFFLKFLGFQTFFKYNIYWIYARISVVNFLEVLLCDGIAFLFPCCDDEGKRLDMSECFFFFFFVLLNLKNPI
jgi:hypothetical protein